MSLSDRLSTLGLGRMVGLAAGIPLALAVLLALALVLDYGARLRETARLDRAIALSAAISQLVHDQQRERGATSLYLSSGGRDFAAEVATERARTDGSLAAYRAVVTQVEAAALDPVLARALARAEARLAGRQEMRARIDAQDVPPAEALAHFSAGNEALIGAVSGLAKLASDPRASGGLAALAALQTAKERAGLERATGAGGFAAGEFPLPALLRLQALIAEQDLALTQFAAQATEAQAAALKAFRALPATREVARLRAIAFAWPQAGTLEGVTGPDYFAATSEEIDALRQMEKDLLATVATRVAALDRAALWTVAGLAAGVLALVGGCFVLVLLILRTTTRAVGGVVETATAMAGGELDAPMPETRLPEIGRIGAALAAFRDSILAARRREAAAAEAKASADRAEAERLEAERRAETARLAAEAREAAETAARERRIAGEIADIVAACAAGDFSRRIDTSDKDGVFAELCDGMNRIGEAADEGLGAVREAMAHLAKGDLLYRMALGYPGVFGEMAAAMNATADSLAGTMTGISVSSRAVDVSAREISTAADDLARRSEHNAAMLEETASALEQMSVSVSSAASAAATVQSAVAEISGRADVGHAVVRDVVAAMDRISASSEAIEKILKVIDDIAFQTNLLALNAGVEAARAGESGRGFAVVASEVRALAQRSGEAARDISDLIETAGTNVRRGVDLAHRSGAALQEIVAGVGDVTGRVRDITAAATETATGIAEISRATTELDRATQQNAAVFEQTSAAVRSLEAEAASLAQSVAAFRLDDPGQDDGGAWYVPPRERRAG